MTTDPRPPRDRAERVLWLSPLAYHRMLVVPGRLERLLDALGLPRETLVVLDPEAPTHDVGYGMSLLEALRNRWQDWDLGS